MVDFSHLSLLHSVLVQNFWLDHVLLGRSLALELHASLPLKIGGQLISFLVNLELLLIIETALILLELQSWKSIFKHRVRICLAVGDLDVEVARG